MNDWRSFKEAKSFVKIHGLKNRKEWKEYCKSGEKPDDIPFAPNYAYEDKGWVSWDDFLETGELVVTIKQYKSFEEAKTFAKALGLKYRKDWKEYCKSCNIPVDIPNKPNKVYKNKGWVTWFDFLGNGEFVIYNENYKPFKEAKNFIKKLGLKSIKEWYEYCKSGNKPDDIPAMPKHIYKRKGWRGMENFLGIKKIKIYKTFENAKIFAKTLDLNSMEEWYDYYKSGEIPKTIPINPNNFYENVGWISWDDFLGIDIIAYQKELHKRIENAKNLVKIYKLNLSKEKKDYSKLRTKSGNIQTFYYKIPNNEWLSKVVLLCVAGD